MPKELTAHSPVPLSEKLDRFISTCLVPVTFSANGLVLRRKRYHLFFFKGLMLCGRVLNLSQRIIQAQIKGMEEN